MTREGKPRSVKRHRARGIVQDWSDMLVKQSRCNKISLSRQVVNEVGSESPEQPT